MAKKERGAPEINASSMADIAFLLLVFFLVTTTIDVERGIAVKLPEWSNEPPEEINLKQRNVFSVLVNAQNQLLVRGELAKIEELRDRAKEFIMNPSANPELSEAPNQAIISLKNDRGTSYETYIEVYNELKAAYNELWDEETMRIYGVHYSEDLPKDKKDKIKAKIPFVLSEAEPTAFGEEAK
ncbi:MAG: biopolymer transporter ExbD [Lewinellaceae bacterium]|nr:biopolymer transporter ExbD [Saprospiraceae bacterium]MCB9341190.1 biopolymer transporter ExbD [Lewinellaceae bacterium]